MILFRSSSYIIAHFPAKTYRFFFVYSDGLVYMSEKLVGKVMAYDLTDGTKRSQNYNERMQVGGCVPALRYKGHGQLIRLPMVLYQIALVAAFLPLLQRQSGIMRH